MKKVDSPLKETNEECFEILKNTIVKDKELKKYTIDKDTLLHKLPEDVIDGFLDFLSGFDSISQQATLKMIKDGIMTIECQEEDEKENDLSQTPLGKIKKKHKEKLEKNLNHNYLDSDMPF